jgi:chemotaxis response regulator CheB
MGGTVIAQDQATSEFLDMPLTAIGTGMVDFILPLASIAPKLLSLVGK